MKAGASLNHDDPDDAASVASADAREQQAEDAAVAAASNEKHRLHCNSVAFSADGQFLVVAMANGDVIDAVRGQVSVYVAARPADGPIAQFIAPAEVTCVSAGNALPQINLQDGPRDARYQHGPGSAGSHHSLTSLASHKSRHHLRGHDASDAAPAARAHAPGVRLTILAGDTEGSVAVLNLMDVMRLAYNVEGTSDAAVGTLADTPDLSEPAMLIGRQTICCIAVFGTVWLQLVFCGCSFGVDVCVLCCP